MDYNSSSKLHSFLLEKQIATVLQYPLISFKMENMEDGNLLDRPTFSDRFKLLIPYCGSILHWEVILNAFQEVPPDFIFPQGEECFSPLAHQMKTIVEWRLSDANALLMILLELLEYYRLFQEEKVKCIHSERMNFEYSTIISHFQNKHQLLVINQSDELMVQCLILLSSSGFNISSHNSELIQDPNNSDTSESVLIGNSFENGLSLLLRFYSISERPPDIKLQIPENSLYEILLSGMRLPSWSCDMCTISYIPIVSKIISGHFKDLLNRRKLIESFQNILGSALEVDMTMYQRALFFGEDKRFVYTVLVTIPLEYPLKPPLICFATQGNLARTGKPCYVQYNNIPWSPRWPIEEYTQRTKNWILENYTEFRRLCQEEHNNG